jgi:hypothetical protein
VNRTLPDLMPSGKLESPAKMDGVPGVLDILARDAE